MKVMKNEKPKLKVLDHEKFRENKKINLITTLWMFYFVVCLFFLILCLKFRYVEYLLLVQLFSSHGGGVGAKDTRVSEHLKDGNDQSDEQLIPGQVINLRTIRSFPHKQLCTHSSLPGCVCVVSPRWGSITKNVDTYQRLRCNLVTSSSRVPGGKNRKLLCLLIHNYENEDNKGAGLREERTQARGVESMRHTVLSFTSRASYCDMILKSRPKFLRITFALVPPLISVLSGYSRPLLPPLPYSHPDYRFGQILVGERISDCLCFTKKKKWWKASDSMFSQDGPQIKIMKTQTSV